MRAGNRMRPDVLVIGAGLVGICTALYLQHAGRRVTLVERGAPADGASGHNAGIFSLGNCLPTATPGVLRALPHMLTDPLSPLAIRWSYLPRLTPWLARFVLASRRSRVEPASVALKQLLDAAMPAYEPLLARCDPPTPLGAGGHLLGYRTEASFARSEFEMDVRARRGVNLKILDEADLAGLDPLLGGRFRHGVLFPDAPFTGDPRALATALASGFVRHGGELRRAEVHDFEVSGGTVQAAVTTDGRFAAGAFVIAAGAWSGRLVRRLGTRIPLDTERGYGVTLPDPGFTLRIPVVSADHHFALTPTGSGLRLAGTDELAGLSAPPDYRRADRLVEAARVIFPELRTEGATRWMSFRPSLPDSLPIIGPAPRQSNAYLAFGHGHIGLTLAAITGRLVQELMDDHEPSIDLDPFRPTRFARRRGRSGHPRSPGAAPRRDGRPAR